MEMVEVVIRIPKQLHDYIKKSTICGKRGAVRCDLLDTIADGIVLPKGHGRLIDADKYRHLWVDTYDSNYGDECAKLFKGSVDNADTIIEADGGAE